MFFTKHPFTRAILLEVTHKVDDRLICKFVIHEIQRIDEPAGGSSPIGTVLICVTSGATCLSINTAGKMTNLTSLHYL